MERELLPNGTQVYVDENIKFGRDALLLSRFAIKKRNQLILDMGTGCGIVSFAAIDDNKNGHYVALDIDETACALVRSSVAANSLHHIEVVCGDLKTYTASHKFDIVVCNPPYFALGTGTTSARTVVRHARHESSCTIGDVAQAAMRNLKQRGSFCFCYRPNRLVDALCACRANRLEPKHMQFVKHRASDEPWLVLIDARLDTGVGLKQLPDLVTESDS